MNLYKNCPVWDGTLSLSVFEDFPEEFLYTEWGAWGVCDSVSLRRIRLRECQNLFGIDSFCKSGNLIDSLDCKINDKRYFENDVSINIEDSSTVTVFDLQYCKNEYGLVDKFIFFNYFDNFRKN